MRSSIKPSDRQRLHRSRRGLLLHQPARRAIKQFEHSLSIDPKHTKTLLNIGIVKAFGKQDLNGAAAAWQQVVALAPDTPEGQAAKKALEGLQNAHPHSVTGDGRAGSRCSGSCARS